MKTCPACASGFYNTYSNGNKKEGYCERCAYESSEPTTEMDDQPVINIDRRVSKSPSKDKNSFNKKNPNAW